MSEALATEISSAEKSKATKGPWWAWIIIALLAPVAFFGPEHVLITTTDSLPYRFWWRSDLPDQSAIGPGTYLAFKKIHPWTDAKEQTLMVKLVKCGPGQELSMNGLNYYCDGQWLGEAITKDSKGRDLNPQTLTGVIPPGHYFMSGQHPRSFDSKYYGLVSYEELELHVKPIF